MFKILRIAKNITTINQKQPFDLLHKKKKTLKLVLPKYLSPFL
jgi:hypothetical protein